MCKKKDNKYKAMEFLGKDKRTGLYIFKDIHTKAILTTKDMKQATEIVGEF